jgi:hypothetical protein
MACSTPADTVMWCNELNDRRQGTIDTRAHARAEELAEALEQEPRHRLLADAATDNHRA